MNRKCNENKMYRRFLVLILSLILVLPINSITARADSGSVPFNTLSSILTIDTENVYVSATVFLTDGSTNYSTYGVQVFRKDKKNPNTLVLLDSYTLSSYFVEWTSSINCGIRFEDLPIKKNDTVVIYVYDINNPASNTIQSLVYSSKLIKKSTMYSAFFGTTGNPSEDKSYKCDKTGYVRNGNILDYGVIYIQPEEEKKAEADAKLAAYYAAIEANKKKLESMPANDLSDEAASLASSLCVTKADWEAWSKKYGIKIYINKDEVRNTISVDWIKSVRGTDIALVIN